jgi:hypothetical protein
MKTIGILTGRERTFPDALIAHILRRDEGVSAEYAKLDITPVSQATKYAVVLDRISHEITCYQPMLKVMMLHGTRVVNNPFWRIADDKAFGTGLVERLGVPVPKTWVLPSKAYGPDISPASLHNLKFPLDWEGMANLAGFPMFIKPHWGGGFRDVYRVNNIHELWSAYDRTNSLTMIAQEEIVWEQYVRCIVIGKKNVQVLPWDPRLPHHERYTGAEQSMPALAPDLLETIEKYALIICQSLGYDMNTCEFAVRDGVPYAIDFMNSAPDFDRSSLGADSFAWVVEKMSDFLVEQAKLDPPELHQWGDFLTQTSKLGRWNLTSGKEGANWAIDAYFVFHFRVAFVGNYGWTGSVYIRSPR